MGAEVRYCTTEDGIRIAYSVDGEGPPLIALAAFFESFSQEHLMPGRAVALRTMSRGRQLVYVDMRGTGLSDKDVQDVSVIGFRRDVDAVREALGVERVALLGSITGGVIAIDYTAQYPERVDRLVLHTTFAKIADAFSSEMVESVASLARSNWDLTARTLADLGARREDPDVGLQAAERIKRSMTGEFVTRMLAANAGLDLKSQLSRIDAPTLVLHPVDEPVYPLALGQGLAAAIPNARLLPMQHAGYDYESLPTDVVSAINTFLNEGLDSSQPGSIDAQGPVRTVLVTDLAGSTEMMSRLGDERGRAVLREHERITRDILKTHDGYEIKTMGDGFMASFASVSKAVECAIAIQRALEERNSDADELLSVRIGLSAGEPIEEEGDLFGATVILASRIASTATGGQILASLAVRELCAGKGFHFADRGEHHLRGFDEAVRIFEITSRA